MFTAFKKNIKSLLYLISSYGLFNWIVSREKKNSDAPYAVPLNVQEEIKTQPTSFAKMARYVRRRIVAKEGVPYLSVEDQQNLVCLKFYY